MTTKHTIASIFDISQTPCAIKEIAHLHSKVAPVEHHADFQHKTVLEVVQNIVKESTPGKDNGSDYDEVFLAGLLLALPEAPDFALLLASPISKDTEPLAHNAYDACASSTIEAYLLPKDLAYALDADLAYDLNFSVNCPHIPLGPKLSKGQDAPLFAVKADTSHHESVTPSLLQKYRLTKEARPFVDLVLSKFWVNAYEPSYFAFPQDDSSFGLGVVFSFPSLLRIAGLCAKSALESRTEVFDASKPVNLDFASRDIGNYAKLLQNEYTPFYWGTRDFFLTATWEIALSEALGQRADDSLSSLQCITEKFNSGADFFSPKTLLGFPELSGKGGQNKDCSTVFEVKSQKGYAPVSGKGVSSLFTHPKSEFTTTLFSTDRIEVESNATTVAELVGVQSEYEIATVQRFSSKSLRDIYQKEIEMAVKAIDELSSEIMVRDLIPF